MHLITMAHLGEAQSVIENFGLKRITPHIFDGEHMTCLITGEGPFEAATATAKILGQKNYTKVINLGIAGTLDDGYEIGKIYPVRSVYLINDGKLQFKSFPSCKDGLDCLTSFERILNSEKAKILVGIGTLVDREAWGVAMAAKSSSVEFEAYKLISDRAGNLGACELVKEQASLWSQRLAHHLQGLIIKSPSDPLPFELPGLHFTFTTEHQFKDMLRKLALRSEISEQAILETLPLENLRGQNISPKERTRLLLKQMEKRLDPLKHDLEEKLQEWKGPWEKMGIHLQTDPSWESSQIKITFVLENHEDLKGKLHELESLDPSVFYQLRNGNFNVE